MIQARIHHGRVEVQDPIPADWEGQIVKVTPLTPDDGLPDLESRLTALLEMAPMEFEAGEREEIAAVMEQVNTLSIEAIQHLPDRIR